MHERLSVVLHSVEVDVDARGFEQEHFDVEEIAVVEDDVEETTSELLTIENHVFYEGRERDGNVYIYIYSKGRRKKRMRKFSFQSSLIVS